MFFFTQSEERSAEEACWLTLAAGLTLRGRRIEAGLLSGLGRPVCAAAVSAEEKSTSPRMM
jgi:hypothetical protein